MTLCEWLQYASSVSLGVFTGAMLTEGSVLVPHWRSLSAAEFFAWYASNDERLLRFFGALTAAAVLTTVAAAIAGFATGAADRWDMVNPAVFILAAAALFPLYFAKANARFSAGSIAPEELPAELARWAKWHSARTAIATVAFVTTQFP